MYKFQTKTGKRLITEYSPLEISAFYCFDASDKNGDSIVLKTASVNFKSFEFI